MRSITRLAAAVVVASSIGPQSSAQGAPGDHVRLTHDNACCGNPLTGTFVRATADSLWIRPAGAPSSAAPVGIARQSVRQFEREEIVGAHRLLGTGVGLVAGALAGYAIGTGATCDRCDFRDAPKFIAVLGGLVGTIAGFAIGSYIPHHEWQQRDTPRSVGMTVGPQGSMQLTASMRY
jgi:hypothetical protein